MKRAILAAVCLAGVLMGGEAGAGGMVTLYDGRYLSGADDVVLNVKEGVLVVNGVYHEISVPRVKDGVLQFYFEAIEDGILSPHFANVQPVSPGESDLSFFSQNLDFIFILSPLPRLSAAREMP